MKKRISGIDPLSNFNIGTKVSLKKCIGNTSSKVQKFLSLFHKMHIFHKAQFDALYNNIMRVTIKHRIIGSP